MSTSVINQSSDDLRAYWMQCRNDPSCLLRDAREIQGSLLEALDKREDAGFSCPLLPAWKMQGSELTIWGGESGAGKSLFLGQMAGWLLKAGKKVCIMSFEMPPVETFLRMITQAYGCRPTKDQALQWFRYTAGRCFCYSDTGLIDPDVCFGCVAFAIGELGCQHIIVDNLMMLTSGSTSDSTMASQKEVVETLKKLAMDTRSHIHLVAHLRKGRDDREPTKDDVAGTSNIGNLADNVLILFRNKEKRRQLESQLMATKEWDRAEPDCYLRLAKNRRSGLDTKVKLWYDRRSLQLCGSERRQPFKLLPDEMLPDDFSTFDRELLARQFYTREVDLMSR